jgi:undecaprenyl diphosphate synthase
MLQAIEALSLSKNTVTKESLKAALMTHDLPPVDYLIRTGGDPHLSAGFMMWDTANAELFFTDTLFPDFGKEAFIGAITEYGERARRGGK